MKSVEIKLVNGKSLFHSTQELHNEDTIFVSLKIVSNSNNQILSREMKSTSKTFSQIVTWNELFSFEFKTLNVNLNCSIFVILKKKPVLIGKCFISMIEKGNRFIQGVPLTFIDYKVVGSKNDVGSLTVSITPRNFGVKPLDGYTYRMSVDGRAMMTNPKRISNSGGGGIKEWFKMVVFRKGAKKVNKFKSFTDYSMKFDKNITPKDDMKNIDMIPKIITQQKLVEMKVHETPSYIGNKYCGVYSGNVVPYKDGEFLYAVGLGKFELANKTMVYLGTFRKGRRNGKGKLYLKNNDQVFIQGIWEDDLPIGKCEISSNEGDKYYGEVKTISNDLMNLNIGSFRKHGFGSYYSKSKGYSYYGHFKDDKKDGVGILDNLKDSTRYVGKWKLDKPDGIGCKSFIDGSIHKGKYHNGSKVSVGKYYLSNGYVIEGKSGSVTGGIAVREGNYSSISKDVLMMIDNVLKSQMRQEEKADEYSKRNKLMWSALFDVSKLEKQLNEVNEQYNCDMYLQFDKQLLYYILSDRSTSGYLCESLDLFCEYFIHMYSIEDVRSKKHRLLYAKDDVSSFLKFITNEFINCFAKYNTRKSFTSVDHLRNVSQSVLVKGENIDFNKHSVSKGCFLDYIHKKIHKVFFSLYLDEHKEKEIWLKQKINSIRHAIGSMTIEKKISILKLDLGAIQTENDYEVFEVDALKSLLQSITSDHKEQENCEQNFLSSQIKSIQKRLDYLKNNPTPLNTQLYKEMKPFTKFIKSKVVISKEKLKHLESLIKKSRVGICSVIMLQKSKMLKKFYEFLENMGTLDSSHQLSLNNQIESLIDSYTYIINNKKAKLSDDILPLVPAIEAVITELGACFQPSYIKMSELKKSVNERIESIKLSLIKFKVKHNINFEKCNIGSIKMIKQKSKKNNELIKALKLEKKNLKFIDERWNTVYRCQQIQFDLKTKYEFLDIITQVKSICSQIKKSSKSNNVTSYILKRFQSVIHDFDYIISSDENMEKKSFIEFIIYSMKKRLISIRNIIKGQTKSKQVEDEDFHYFFNILQNSDYSYQLVINQFKYLKVVEEVNRKIVMLEKTKNDKNVKGINVLKHGKSLIFQIPYITDTIQLIQTIKTLEIGVKSIQMRVESSEVYSKIQTLEGKLLISEVKNIINSTMERIHSLSVDKKIECIENVIYKIKGDQTFQIHLESLGVRDKFVPPFDQGTNNPPYYKAIRKINELKEKRSIGDKLEVIKDFEKIFQGQMKKYSKKKMLEEDDILPVVIYIFLKSDLDHYAEYAYLNDWKTGWSLFLMRYDVFIKYCADLNPYARREQGGELLSVLGSMLTPIKNSIDQITTATKKKVNLRWLVNLLNFIYCEIGFLKPGTNLLEIRNKKLKDSIVKDFDNVRLILGKNMAFSVDVDTQFEDKLIIEFENIYSPEVYMWCAKAVLKDFKDSFD